MGIPQEPIRGPKKWTVSAAQLSRQKKSTHRGCFFFVFKTGPPGGSRIRTAGWAQIAAHFLDLRVELEDLARGMPVLGNALGQVCFRT